VTEATLYALAASVLIGLGVFGLIAGADPLRKILAFNIVGTGVFLLAGAIARRGAGAGFEADPVLMALLITGIVVAFSATALAVALLVRLQAVAGDVSLAEAPPVDDDK
jgi:multicomponent Na+:H+ antiporter subunit C